MKERLESYSGKKVFVTGHTGFKGTWLCRLLQTLGAEVVGYSLASDSQGHFEALNFEMKSYFANINDFSTLKKALASERPDFVFHLAAQALVLPSYDNPIETYETNVMGTLRVYQAAHAANVPVIVSVTTDKVYENRNWQWGYRENDSLGGSDPYSSSKACVELMTNSFRSSFLQASSTRLATVRAGNVIGGGDWALHRLIPDLVRGAMAGTVTMIRSGASVRPWQHVLDPLVGYLLLASCLAQRKSIGEESFNFGPSHDRSLTVSQVCLLAKEKWGRIQFLEQLSGGQNHEEKLLKLDSTRAKEVLGWNPLWSSEKAITMTMGWYQSWVESKNIQTDQDIRRYLEELSI